MLEQSFDSIIHPSILPPVDPQCLFYKTLSCQTCFPRVKSWLGNTFSIRSIVCCRSIPKSMKVHSIPSLVYSSCSRINMWWLKNCCNFSLVKLMQSCSKLLNCSTKGWKGKAENRKERHKQPSLMLLIMIFVIYSFSFEGDSRKNRGRKYVNKKEEDS